jgi:hypothetical protein
VISSSYLRFYFAHIIVSVRLVLLSDLNDIIWTSTGIRKGKDASDAAKADAVGLRYRTLGVSRDI